MYNLLLKNNPFSEYLKTHYRKNNIKMHQKTKFMLILPKRNNTNVFFIQKIKLNLQHITLRLSIYNVKKISENNSAFIYDNSLHNALLSNNSSSDMIEILLGEGLCVIIAKIECTLTKNRDSIHRNT